MASIRTYVPNMNVEVKRGEDTSSIEHVIRYAGAMVAVVTVAPNKPVHVHHAGIDAYIYPDGTVSLDGDLIGVDAICGDDGCTVTVGAYEFAVDAHGSDGVSIAVSRNDDIIARVEIGGVWHDG